MKVDVDQTRHESAYVGPAKKFGGRREDLAWAAGLFKGEDSLALPRHGKSRRPSAVSMLGDGRRTAA